MNLLLLMMRMRGWSVVAPCRLCSLFLEDGCGRGIGLGNGIFECAGLHPDSSVLGHLEVGIFPCPRLGVETRIESDTELVSAGQEPLMSLLGLCLALVLFLWIGFL